MVSGSYSISFEYNNKRFEGKPKVSYRINATEPYYSYIKDIIKAFW